MRLFKGFSLSLMASTVGTLLIWVPAQAQGGFQGHLSPATQKNSSQNDSPSESGFQKSSQTENSQAAAEEPDLLGRAIASQLSSPLTPPLSSPLTPPLSSPLPPQLSSPLTPQLSSPLAPPLAQIPPSTEALTEANQPVITPPVPINSQLFNEGLPGEVEGEIDETVIRQVPSSLLQPAAAYSIRVAPVDDPRVLADRRSLIKIGGSIVDANGEVLRSDVVVTLTASAGEFIGADYDIDRAGFQVLARRGEFEAELRSSLDAQRVVIRASAARDDLLAQTPMPLADNLADGPREIEGYTEVSFITPLRPSLVTGVVDLRLGPGATNLWGSFRDFLDPDKIGKTEFSARTAVFATGAIGDWLFTGAYNSARNLNERCDGITRLFADPQSCDNAYPVYGDSSINDYLTPSIDSVYLRLQQDAAVPQAEPNYFMWGDYSTEEFARSSQLFSATNRQLHGFVGNYTLGSGSSGLQLTAMYANNIRPFQRDTIVPDGTSGYYFLSRPLVLGGSEEIYIEVEELNRPGTVVERVALIRGADYTIDYDRGAILFNQPISVTDVNPFGPPLVRRIVATYQVDGQDTGGDLFGGRAQYNFSYDLDSPSWIGASVVTENNNASSNTLYGLDALLSLGTSGQLVAEYARSSLSGTAFGISGNGSAYRLEANNAFGDNVIGRAYVRGADEGFSNNTTASFRPGQTRYGAQISALVTPGTQLDLQYDQEENRGTATAIRTGFEALRQPGFFPVPGTAVDNSLTTIRAGLQQQIGSATADLAYVYRDRTDRIGSLNFNSSQLVSGLTMPIANNLTFRAQNELNLGSNSDPVYPGRTVFGLDYQPIPEITVRLAQQFLNGNLNGNNVAPTSITSLDTLLDYDLSDNTQLTGRYSILGGLSGMTGQGAVGLNHRWNISPGLNIDLGYERVVGEGLGVLGTGERFEQPFAVGQSAAALGISPGSTYSIGLEYLDNRDFQASARAEFRDNDNTGDNTVLTASLAGRVSPALTALGRFEYANYANQILTGRFGNTSSLKLGMAYRDPNSDKFNGLLSYEYATNPSITINSPGSNTITEHTLAAEGIYAPNYAWEFYGKYGLRTTNADLFSQGLSSISNTIHLAQLRAAYRFAYRWDLVGEMRYISQPSVNYDEVGFGLETGYYVTPDLRLGVGYSFGRANDRSFSGSGYRSDDGFYLAATFKVNELFNGFGLQDVTSEQQGEFAANTADEVAVDDVCPRSDARSDATNSVDPCARRVPEIMVQPYVPSAPLPTVQPPAPPAPTFAPEPVRGLW